MTEIVWTDPPPRAELLARIRAELDGLGVSLRILAADVLGAEARIDWLAADPDGRVHVILVSTEPDDLALVALGLAQRAWVEARLADWVQLAPGQGLRADGGVRAVLIAPRFSATAEAAVRAAGDEHFDLLCYRCLAVGPNGAEPRVLLEASRLGGQRAEPALPSAPPPASRFRTGLADSDLLVSSTEKRGLEIPAGSGGTKIVTRSDNF